MSMEEKMLSIYVSSYDGAEDLWQTFFDIFFTYWRECEYDIYLINNEKKFKYEKKEIKTVPMVIHTGVEINWFYRTIQSLKKIKTKYVLFMLEDYYYSRKQNNEEYEKIISFMEEHNAWFYQLTNKPEIKIKINGVVKIANDINYPVNLQPAVWNREKLIKVLEEIDGVTPWDFELYFKKNSEVGDGSYIPGAYYDDRDIMGYKNGVLRGRWIRSTIEFYKKRGIKIYTGERERLSRWKEFKFWCAGKMSTKLSAKEKRVIKRLLSIIKFKYLE